MLLNREPYRPPPDPDVKSLSISQYRGELLAREEEGDFRAAQQVIERILKRLGVTSEEAIAEVSSCDFNTWCYAGEEVFMEALLAP